MKNNSPAFIINPPLQKIAQASKTTGLSQYYLRNGCKDGSIPHILSGTTYFINIPKLFEMLDVPYEGRCAM